jgi:hypothetical protein
LQFERPTWVFGDFHPFILSHRLTTNSEHKKNEETIYGHLQVASKKEGGIWIAI